MKIESENVVNIEEMHSRRPGVMPKMWSEEEDTLLRSAIATHGEKAWKMVAKQVPGRTYIQCLQRWKKALKPGLRKGHWSESEDATLLRLIAEYEPNLEWGMIAKFIPGRSAKQCRERWCLNLDPSINHGPWSAEEDHELMEFVRLNGGKWSLIAKHMPGRTENSVKTRYYSIQRKEARRKRWTEEEDQVIIESVLVNGRDFEVLDGAMKHRTKGQIKKRYTWLVQRNPNLLKRVRNVEDDIRRKKRKTMEPQTNRLLRTFSTSKSLYTNVEPTSDMSNMSIDINPPMTNGASVDQQSYQPERAAKPNRSRLIRKTISTAILEDLIKPEVNPMYPMLDASFFGEPEDAKCIERQVSDYSLMKMNSLEVLHNLIDSMND